MTLAKWAGTIAALVLVHGSACGGDADTNDDGNGGTGASATGGQGGVGAAAGNGGTSAGGGGGANVTEEQYCTGKAVREAECTVEGEPETYEECLAASNTACFFEMVRPEILAELVTCLNDRPCGQSDDSCFHTVGANSPTAGQEDYLAECSAKGSACPGDFPQDWCGLTYATTLMYAELSTCFALDCSGVRDCLRGSRPVSCQ